MTDLVDRTSPMRVLCIGGSTRAGSSSEQALRVTANAVEAAGATSELLTGTDLVLPIYAPEEHERHPRALRLIEAARSADAIVVSSPGYHGAMSGMIKNVLDHLEDLRTDSRPYLDGMPVGCLAVAHGWQAAVSTLHNLRSVVHALRGWPSPLGATINTAAGVFDTRGHCTDDATRQQLHTIGDQIVGFAAHMSSPVTPGE